MLSLASALGGPVVGIALATLWEETAAAYLLGLWVGYAGSAAVGLLLTLRGRRVQHHRGDTRRALRIGLPTVPHQVALFLASGILVLVASSLYGSSNAGRLQLAVLIGSAPGVLTSSLNNAWAPVVYRTPEAHRGEVLEHTGRNIGWLTSLAAGFVAVTAPLLLSIVAPPSYDARAMTPAVALVAAGTVLSVLYLSNVHLVFASGRSTGLAVVTPVSLGIGTAAAVVAGNTLGLAAIGVGMTVTYAALATGTATLARQVSRTPWRWQALLSPLALGVVLCLTGGLLPSDGGWLLARIVLAALLTATSAGVLLRALRR
jgi:O-antigen/teichoic acid export membrane protein